MSEVFNVFQLKNINNQQTKNTNRFSLQFHGLATLLGNGKASKLPGYKKRFEAVFNALERDSRSINEILQMSLVSCTPPNVMIETMRLQRFNDSAVATTKFGEPEDMTVTFYDYVNGSASAILKLWEGLVGDKRTGAMGFKKDFVLPYTHLVSYGPDAPKYEDTDDLPAGYTEIPWLEKHEIVNLFPKQVNLGEFNMESGEARRVEVTFSVDNIYPISYNVYTGQGAYSAPVYSGSKHITTDVPATVAPLIGEQSG